MIVPASIRNRNPGAMYPGPSAKKFGGKTFETLKSKDGVHKIATFPSDIQGAAAMFDLLHNGKTKLGNLQYRGKTIEDAIKTWCGGFYVSTYIKVLEEQGGIKRTDPLTSDILRDPSKAVPLARAMAWQEAGRDYPLTDEEWKQAHQCCFASPTAPAFATDNDVPSPKPETRFAEAVKNVAKVGVPAVVGTGGAATVATGPGIPLPPTGALETATAWRGFSGQVLEFGAFAVGNPKSLAVIGIAIAAMVLGPKIAPSWFGRE